MATLEQLKKGLYLADQAGDEAGAKVLAQEISRMMQSDPPSPGLLKSAGRGAIGGTLGLLDLGTQVAGYPARKLYEAAGGTVPGFLGPSNVAQVAQAATGLDQPPATQLERFAELAGSSLVPGAGSVGLAARAGRSMLPMAAVEAGSLGGSHLGREAGRSYGGEGSTSEILGMLAGGLTPYGLGGLSRQLSAPAARYSTREGQQEALSAFDRQQVPPTLADVTDQSYPQKAISHLPGGISTFKKSRETQSGAMEQAVARLAPDIDDVTAGQAIIKGIKGYVEGRFKTTSGKLSKKLDAAVPADTPAELTNTKALFEKMRTEKGPFQKSLGVPPITTMEKEIKAAEKAASKVPEVPARSTWDFMRGAPLPKVSEVEEVTGVDFQTLRRMRTAIGHKISSTDLVSEIPRVDLKRIYGAMSEDIKIAAAAAGPQAEKALRKLNNYWGKGIQRVDDFLEPISKKVTPEEAYRAVVKAAKDSPTRILNLRKTLKPEQREVVISNMLRKMGEPNPGVRSIDYTFSPETFLTNLNRVDEKNFAKLAEGTAYHKSKDLADMKLIAGRLREVDKTLKNPSETAETLIGTGAVGAVGGSLFLGFDVTASTLLALGGMTGGAKAVSSLMTNPKFIRWTVAGSKLPKAKYASHLSRLATVMRDQEDEAKWAAAQFIQQAQTGQGEASQSNP